MLPTVSSREGEGEEIGVTNTGTAGVVVEHATYKDACKARGLLADDSEWEQAMEDACRTTTRAGKLRELFATIVVFNNPTDPMKMLNRFALELGDDKRKKFKLGHGREADANVRALVLRDLEDRMYRLGMRADAANIIITEQERARAQRVLGVTTHTLPTVVLDELAYDSDQMRKVAAERFAKVRPMQAQLLDKVVRALARPEGERIFVDAPGGTGKTYCFNALLAHVRAKGDIAIAVASSGIAALLLYQGRTCHSRMKCSLKPQAGESLNVNVQSDDGTAQLLRMAKLIVWDEVGMMHRYHLEVRAKIVG